MWRDLIIEEIHSVRAQILKEAKRSTKAIDERGQALAARMGLRVVKGKPRAPVWPLAAQVTKKSTRKAV